VVAKVGIQRGLIRHAVVGAEHHPVRVLGVHDLQDACIGEPGEFQHFLHVLHQPCAEFARNHAFDAQVDFVEQRHPA
jgi:hypothetical protein